jgi:hypothetical protein
LPEIYAFPRTVTDLSECYFYHTIDLPNYGLLKGEWDLRSGVDDYLGRLAFQNKRVLEIGTASGFLCFEMERRGAEMVAYDLSENDAWDVVPYGGKISIYNAHERKERIRQINNAWWLTHRLHNSQARMVYGRVYDLPVEIGEVDIITFGSILLHLRDPFLALQRAAVLARESIVVTEALPVSHRTRVLAPLRWLARLDVRLATYLVPEINFLPDPATSEPRDTWWNLAPNLIERFLKILGFQNTCISSHHQIHHYGENLQNTRKRAMYTVVGHK